MSKPTGFCNLKASGVSGCSSCYPLCLPLLLARRSLPACISSGGGRGEHWRHSSSSKPCWGMTAMETAALLVQHCKHRAAQTELFDVEQFISKKRNETGRLCGTECVVLSFLLELLWWFEELTARILLLLCFANWNLKPHITYLWYTWPMFSDHISTL